MSPEVEPRVDFASTSISARVPSARLRPPRLRTVSRSSL